MLFTWIQSGSAGKAQLRGSPPWIESLAREPDSGVFADLGAKMLVDPALKLLLATGRCVSIDGLHYVVGAPAAQLLDVLGGHSEVVEGRCENVAQVMEIHSVAVFVHVLSETLVQSVVAERMSFFNAQKSARTVARTLYYIVFIFSVPILTDPIPYISGKL